MAYRSTTRAAQRGLTLVELLMVLTIAAILFAVSIPMIRPAFEDRALREASRQINAFFAGARARAAASGRPVGVWLERSIDVATGASYCSQLFMAEASPAFTGATLNSRAWVHDTGELVFSSGDEPVLQMLLHTNEVFRIQFDHKGFRYYGTRNPTAPEFRIDIPGGVPPGTAIGGIGLPYAITRAPSRSSVSPLALPGDAVVDLTVSGLGADGYEMNQATNPEAAVLIEFSPSGGVDFVFVDETSWAPFSPVHLLIGRRSKVIQPDPVTVDLSNPEISNLADPANLWLTIGHRTGSVVTTENADTSHMPNDSPAAERIRVAREFARTSIRKGGR